MIARGGAPMNIANGIREFAVATPNATAVIDGDRALTYAALDERASRLANVLLDANLQPGATVAVMLGNRLEFPEIAAGLAKAGLPMVPVNPRSTIAEATYVLEHSAAVALIADDTLVAIAGEAAQTAGVKTALAIGGATLGPSYETALASAATSDPYVVVDETDPFCIAYTSGTTGKPKGVVISHRSRCLTFYGTALEWGLGPGRRTIAVAPMYHGAGFAFAYAALHTGGTVSMLRAFDPQQLLALIASDRPHSVFLVPAHAQMMRRLGDTAITGADTSSLETLYFNAAAMPQELKLWVMDTLPHVGLHEVYGSTEAGIISNLRPGDQRRKVACVGPPWFMTEVRIVDGDGNVLGRDATGELYSRSPYLMNGYLNDDDATKACTTEDGFLTCGDVAHVDEDGYLYVVDRVKDMIISGGVNIYPREVEEVIAHHTSVADVAVVGAPSDLWGEEVVAFIVTPPGIAVDDAALDAHCRTVLSGFKVPKRYVFVDALPRSPAGKILKRELREGLAS
ncbi:MAG: class I adenylate-forming enzyme family protein [Actinomycetota bacterium]|nr:AMP-binding protein [Actinomycetota bacterium]